MNIVEKGHLLNALTVAQEFFLDIPEPEDLTLKEMQISSDAGAIRLNELREGEVQEIHLQVFRQGRYALAYHPGECVLFVAIAN